MPDLMNNHVTAVILAAGKGTRMNSGKAKVLHCLAGKPMINYVLDAACQISGNSVTVVVGTQAEEVEKVVSRHFPVRFARQARQLGTGHAVLCALPALPEDARHVLILCGDVPMITSHTLSRLVSQHTGEGNDLTVLGARIDDPTGYGRLRQRADGTVASIVEEADATAEEKGIRTVNAGIYCAERHFLTQALLQIQNHNAQSEMYLTDIVGIGARDQKRIGLLLCTDFLEISGINTQPDLQKVEALISSK